jgi:hypothetical protein
MEVIREKQRHTAAASKFDLKGISSVEVDWELTADKLELSKKATSQPQKVQEHTRRARQLLYLR